MTPEELETETLIMGVVVLLGIIALLAAPFFLLPFPYSMGVSLLLLVAVMIRWVFGKKKELQAKGVVFP